MSDPSAMGPVEILVVEFDGPLRGEVAPVLAEVIAAGTIRVIDLLIVTRDEDGTVSSTEVADVDDAAFAAWAQLDGEVLGLVNDDDLQAIGAALAPGASAALLVFEHTWAVPMVAALNRAGGRVAVRQHVSVADLEQALAAVGD